MAWDDVAEKLTDGFTVTSGSVVTDQWHSRWTRGTQDPDDRTILHIVREIQGVKASSPTDEVGFYYMRYEIDTDTMVRHVAVEAETAPAGDGHHRAPRISYDVNESRLWVVWVWKSSGDSDPDDHSDAGSLMARYSDDDGATWGSRVSTITGTPQ